MSQKSYPTEKLTLLLKKTIKLLNKSKLSVADIVILYGNLGYMIGHSMAKLGGEPSLEQLVELYKERPTVAIALMITGLMIVSWVKTLDGPGAAPPESLTGLFKSLADIKKAEKQIEVMSVEVGRGNKD